jgi:hypothetical protein
LASIVEPTPILSPFTKLRPATIYDHIVNDEFAYLPLNQLGGRSLFT